MKPKGKIVILLDTSALLYPFQAKVDFVKGVRERFGAQVTLAVAEGTLRELESIRRGSGPSLSMAAEKALTFAKGLKVLRSRLKRTDEQIAKLAKDTGAAVATADSSLRNQLRREGVPVIFVSKGKRIRIEGGFGPGSVV